MDYWRTSGPERPALMMQLLRLRWAVEEMEARMSAERDAAASGPAV